LKKSNLLPQRMFLRTSKLSDVKRKRMKPDVARKKNGDRRNLKHSAVPPKKQRAAANRKKSAVGLRKKRRGAAHHRRQHVKKQLPLNL
jgi:hypothetical protein